MSSRTPLPRSIAAVISLLVLIGLPGDSYSFIPLSVHQNHGISKTRLPSPMVKTTLSMISFSSAKSKPSLPRDVKDAVSQCRGSVQEALQKRLSRMDIEFPVGTKFGVEKTSKRQKTDDGGVSHETLERSDRELARLFVEMFQPVGGDAIAAVFNEGRLADKAKKEWRDSYGSECRVLSLGRRKEAKDKSEKKKTKARGFAAKLAEEMGDSSLEGAGGGPFALPSNCEVALFVSPGPKELVVIEKVCNEVGMGTLVILLNARLSLIDRFGSEDAKRLFTEEFEPVFHLTAAPQDVAPDCLVYRSFPNGWLMARKPKVGPPKVIASSEKRMSKEECLSSFKSIELDKGEEIVEGMIGNVANWFK